VAVLILAALLFADSAPARGAFAALAGLSKFAPLALAPLLAAHGLHSRGLVGISSFRRRAFSLFLLAFVGVAALVSIPALTHDSLHTIYERTIAYQANRGSPFSIWGLYGLHGLQRVVQLAAIALALALAVVPRRVEGEVGGHAIPGLAAACAAVIIATQLGVEHWFYLYIPWFFGLVMLALIGVPTHLPALIGVPPTSPATPEDGATPQEAGQVGASVPARWSPRTGAPSSGSALP
jgi:hypothetical protein